VQSSLTRTRNVETASVYKDARITAGEPLADGNPKSRPLSLREGRHAKGSDEGEHYDTTWHGLLLLDYPAASGNIKRISGGRTYRVNVRRAKSHNLPNAEAERLAPPRPRL